MAIFNRLKDAAKPTNTIENVPPGPAPEPGRQEPRVSAPSAAAPDAPASAVASARDAAKPVKSPAYASEPEAISKAYYVEDRGSERRYFDDYKKTALAIRADDSSINSKREDLNTIRAMLTMAESRGWQEVKVSGTAEFKREAWIEAATRGITAQGYKAGDLDRQEADRRRAERGIDPTRTPTTEGNEVRWAAPQPATEAGLPTPRQTAAVGETMVQPRQAVLAGEAVAQTQRKAEPTVARPVKLEIVASQEAAPSLDKPTQADHRKAVRDAEAFLSDNGKIVLAALSDNIDRKMNQLNGEAKVELKAFAAGELVRKERTEGSIVLSKEQLELAKGPERSPVPKTADAPQRTPATAEAAVEAPKQVPRVVREAPQPEQDRPRRTRSR